MESPYVDVNRKFFGPVMYVHMKGSCLTSSREKESLHEYCAVIWNPKSGYRLVGCGLLSDRIIA